MKHFWTVLLSYRERGKPDSCIQEITFTAHSVQDAKVWFNAWQIRKWNRIRYVVLAGVKLEEVDHVQVSKNNW